MKQESQRAETVRDLWADTLDLLVVGGGIVGSGIARDAAMRGLRMALVEQNDFASGTSSRSSRLLHGGLRYLAQGRLGLVREASVEKSTLCRIASHLTEPLPFLFPTFRGNRHWVLWQLKIGVKIYDLLCGGRNLGKSSWLGREQLLALVPVISPKGLTGAVRYYDAFTNDARLVLDTLRSARNHDGAILNYFGFADARPARSAEDSGFVWECDLQDRETGRQYEVRARAIVNATGPWAGGVPHSQVRLRLTKGIHVVVDRSRLRLPETVVMTEGQRILFAIPWGERTIIGTTDTDYHGSLDHVVPEASDLQYLLGITNQHFPEAKLTAADVISSWAGLRPLMADPNGKPSEISRSHVIHMVEPGWWDVAGGKLTTYRLMAEQTVNQIVRWLGVNSARRGNYPPCRTASEPLLPASETKGISGVLPPEFDKRLVDHYCAREWALHLDDVMLRRANWHQYLRHAEKRAGQVADWMASALNWPESRRTVELERYRQLTAEVSPRGGTGQAPVRQPDDQPAARLV